MNGSYKTVDCNMANLNDAWRQHILIKLELLTVMFYIFFRRVSMNFKLCANVVQKNIFAFKIIFFKLSLFQLLFYPFLKPANKAFYTKSNK